MLVRRFRTSCAIAAAPCLAVLMLWARSYVVSDAIDWDTRTGRAGAISVAGRVSIGHVVAPPPLLSSFRFGICYHRDASRQALANQLKPGWSSWTGFQASYVKQRGLLASDVRIPWWFLELAVATPAALWLKRRYRRSRPGLCRHCGYDLRATPTRCPECGTEYPASDRPHDCAPTGDAVPRQTKTP